MWMKILFTLISLTFVTTLSFSQDESGSTRRPVTERADSDGNPMGFLSSERIQTTQAFKMLKNPRDIIHESSLIAYAHPERIGLGNYLGYEIKIMKKVEQFGFALICETDQELKDGQTLEDKLSDRLGKIEKTYRVSAPSLGLTRDGNEKICVTVTKRSY